MPAAGGPAAGGDEVVELERERAAPPDAAMAIQRFDRLVAAEAREVAFVPLLGGALRRGPAGDELLGRVLVDAQVHAEARFLDVVT